MMNVTRILSDSKNNGGKCMVNVLKQYFPMIRTRGEVLKDISGNERLWELYLSWKEEQQKEFLDFCTGIKGVKILYEWRSQCWMMLECPKCKSAVK